MNEESSCSSRLVGVNFLCTCWWLLASFLAVISDESGRLAMTNILCNVFRTVISTTPQDLLAVVNLSANRIAPAHEGVELGIGDAAIIKVLTEAYGRKDEQIKAQLKVVIKVQWYLCCNNNNNIDKDIFLWTSFFTVGTRCLNASAFLYWSSSLWAFDMLMNADTGRFGFCCQVQSLLAEAHVQACSFDMHESAGHFQWNCQGKEASTCLFLLSEFGWVLHAWACTIQP